MTPPYASFQPDKTVAPDGNRHANSDHQATNSDRSQRSSSDQAGEKHTEKEVLLPIRHQNRAIIYHEIGDDGQPLCCVSGSYRTVSESYAREHADRKCNRCKVVENDGVERRPCLKCGELIPTTLWPQHVGECTAESKRGTIHER
jgi:hypothetical protein